MRVVVGITFRASRHGHPAGHQLHGTPLRRRELNDQDPLCRVADHGDEARRLALLVFVLSRVGRLWTKFRRHTQGIVVALAGNFNLRGTREHVHMGIKGIDRQQCRVANQGDYRCRAIQKIVAGMVTTAPEWRGLLGRPRVRGGDCWPFLRARRAWVCSSRAAGV